MKVINLSKKDAKSVIGKTPTKSEYNQVIEGDTKLLLGGQCVAIYLNIPKKYLKGVREATQSTKYVETYRANGLPTKSSVYGALPRVALRNDFCRFSNKTVEEKANFKKMLDFQNFLCNIYKKHLPEQFALDYKKSKQVDGSYFFDKGSPYTTMNINVNHAIKHHLDSGNLKGSFSNVLILKDGCSGGELVLPEYNLALAQNDGALCIFKGESIIHGVMPLKPHHEGFYRASLVFYTLEQLKHCYPYKEEATRLAKVKRERALKRAKNINPKQQATKNEK